MMAYQDSISDLLLQLSEQCLSLSCPLYSKHQFRNVSEVQIMKKRETIRKFRKIAYSTLLNSSNQIMEVSITILNVELKKCLYLISYDISTWNTKIKSQWSFLLNFVGLSKDLYGKCSFVDGFTEIHALLAIIYNMRVSRKFDVANDLETHLNKLKGACNNISDDIKSSLRFLMCLHGTGKVESPTLGQLRPLPKLVLEKDDCCILPAGTMFYGDTTSFSNSSFFTVYPREIFEQAIPLSVTPPTSQQLALFETCPGYDLNGNELFTLRNNHACKETKEESQFLLGALFHKPRVRGKSPFSVKLEIPEIASSSLRPMDFTFSTTSSIKTNSCMKKPMFSTMSEDEGFIESDSPPSARILGHDTEDIWDAAMKFKPRTYFSWETIGCYDVENDKPYLTEAEPVAVDMIYQTYQYELLLMDPSFNFTVPICISQSFLMKDIINLLIGIPSETFPYVKSEQAFELQQGIHTSGATPESLEKLLSEFIETGSFYHKLEQFSSASVTKSSSAGGLIMQAFKGGISEYLQLYRAYILSFSDQCKDTTVFKLKHIFHGLYQQIRFVADLCKFSLHKKDIYEEKFPMGVELLSYIYQIALEQWGLQNYLLSVFLLKRATAPYLHFLHEWLFEGVCNDFFNEFHMEKNFTYITAEDETYWTKCYVQTTQKHISCVPQFLSDIAADILVCGKSINLLKLCCPKHYLCCSRVKLPPLLFTFSESIVNHVKEESQLYVDSILGIAYRQREAAEQLQKRKEEEKQTLFQYSKMKRSETLAKIQEEIEEANRISEMKKHKQLSDLKAQIEEKMLMKQLEKEKIIEEDIKQIIQIEEQNQRELKIMKDIKAEYQKRNLELEYMEQHAKLLCDKINKGFLNVKNISVNSVNILQQDTDSLLVPLDDISDTNENSCKKKVSRNPNNMTKSAISSYNMTKFVFDMQRSSLPCFEHLEKTASPLLPSVVASDSPLDESSPLEELREKKLSNQISSSEMLLENVLPSSKDQKQIVKQLPDGKKLSFSVDDVNVPIPHQYLSQGNVTDEKITSPHSEYSVCYKGLKKSSEMKSKMTDDFSSEILFPLNCGTTLRSRSVNVHQHSFHSTVQHLIYGDKKNSSLTSDFSLRQISEDMQNSKSHSCSPNKLNKLMRLSFSSPNLTSNGRNTIEHSSKSVILQKNCEDLQEKNKELLKVADDHLMSPCGILFFTNSGNAQRFRKINIHGHSSDSTVQNLIYGYEQHSSHIPDPSSKRPGSSVNKKNNAHGHISDSTVQELIYGAKTDSENSGIKKTRSLQHFNLLSDSFDTFGSSKVHPEVIKGFHYSSPDEHKKELKIKDQSMAINNWENGHFRNRNCTKEENELYSEGAYDVKLHDNISNAFLKYYGKNIHGNTSDSTAQELVYGKEGEEDSPLDDKDPKVMERLDEMMEQNVVALTSEYTPSYKKYYSILDEPPLSGLLTQLQKRSSDFILDDEEEDINVCQYVPLPTLLNRSLYPVVQAQIHLVNKSIIDYFFVDLHINEHFAALRNFFFFNDGEFGHSLSQLLFDKVSRCQSPSELFNPVTLNSILSQALSMSLHGDSVYADCLSFSVKSIPLAFPSTAPSFLKCLDMCYSVGWPRNIIITEKNLVYYNSVLELLLQVKQSLWSLTDVWYHLKKNATYHSLEMSPQYRQLQIYRHEMLHFARVIQSYIASQVLQVTWNEFKDILLTKVHSLDDLRNSHTCYLKKACYRCLLSKKAAPVMKIIKVVFSTILKFRLQLLSFPWKMNDSTGYFEHPSFQDIETVYKSFNENSCFLYKVLNHLVIKGYQPHLKDFLIMLDFNYFYEVTSEIHHCCNEIPQLAEFSATSIPS